MIDALRRGDHDQIASMVHPDDLQLMGANQESVRLFLQDLDLRFSEIGVSEITQTRTGLKMELQSSQGRGTRPIMMFQTGKSWRIGLGGAVRTFCMAEPDLSACTLKVADLMEKHGIEYLVYQLSKASPKTLRQHSAKPKDAYSIYIFEGL
ncbi:MAG: hypothetical protein MH204_10955 [Fimbriimonadaceae bacterium]|nr:hypothetical protein [Fimbriimonadaceae bacterium]